MFNKDGQAGFNRPQEPQDSWTRDLLSECGLPENASLEQIEEKATELLRSPLTMLKGAELVLGRRVDAKDREVTSQIMRPSLNGEDRFGILLLQKSIEDMQREG